MKRFPLSKFANGGLTITSLGTLGGSASEGYGINSSGLVVGGSGTKDGRSHAFRYSAGVMTDLKTLIGNPTIGLNISSARAINDAGQIVGYSVYDSSANFHAVIWQSGKISDLNKQLPRGSAWVLDDAYDINGAGKIVGSGSIGGQHHAFLMVPGGALQAQSVAVSQGYNTDTSRFAANAFFALLTADEEATHIGSSIFGPGRPKR